MAPPPISRSPSPFDRFIDDNRPVGEDFPQAVAEAEEFPQAVAEGEELEDLPQADNQAFVPPHRRRYPHWNHPARATILPVFHTEVMGVPQDLRNYNAQEEFNISLPVMGFVDETSSCNYIQECTVYGDFEYRRGPGEPWLIDVVIFGHIVTFECVRDIQFQQPKLRRKALDQISAFLARRQEVLAQLVPEPEGYRHYSLAVGWPLFNSIRLPDYEATNHFGIRLTPTTAGTFVDGMIDSILLENPFRRDGIVVEDLYGGDRPGDGDNIPNIF